MKTKLLMAAIACIALFSSCDKQGVPHTGDDTGNLYGIWQLDKKTEVIQQKNLLGATITYAFKKTQAQ